MGSTKTLPEIIEHYYTWKKYRNDEYRCRNRHASEEVRSGEGEEVRSGEGEEVSSGAEGRGR